MKNEQLMRELVKGSVVTLIGTDGKQIPYAIYRLIEVGCLKDIQLDKRLLKYVIAEYQIDDLGLEFCTSPHHRARFDTNVPRMMLYLMASGAAHAAWVSRS